MLRDADSIRVRRDMGALLVRGRDAADREQAGGRIREQAGRKGTARRGPVIRAAERPGGGRLLAEREAERAGKCACIHVV
ncbi:hypothetical protein GCM10010298_68490 [Streptomyces microflavus]|uniref:Uncharacterized protein n=1 Tax=Streptomyces microflavus TaxID=1919 RepID=A0A7J0D7I7_STRMI|nr:hypothetical protein Smic_85810 [Streptomyces microflavus]GGX93504.1 hypothetical protein GCM10010298_68490 [Streptomyces microflavus]